MQSNTTKATKATTKTATNARANAKAKAATEAEAKAEAEALRDRLAARDAETIAANRTAYKQYGSRDVAYLTFFGGVMRKHSHKATLAQIIDAGVTEPGKPGKRNPHYSGSNKATDAGAINRLRKAGYITVSPDGSTITATDTARATKAYNGKA